MVDRRKLLGGGILGGVIGAFGASNADRAGAAEADAAQRDSGDDREVAAAIDKLRQQLQIERQFTELSAVRTAQLQFLRANGKLPDFIDVGTGVWFGVHDWHIRWQQPMTLGRDAQGRYTIKVIETTLIMRPELETTFMSIPYDNK